jgi:hypothetical protein
MRRGRSKGLFSKRNVYKKDKIKSIRRRGKKGRKRRR